MVVCNLCGREKEGIKTGLCNHCGRFGLTDRELAMRWWNPLSSEEKTRICEINRQYVGYPRRWETLTGYEIHNLWVYKD